MNSSWSWNILCFPLHANVPHIVLDSSLYHSQSWKIIPVCWNLCSLIKWFWTQWDDTFWYHNFSWMIYYLEANESFNMYNVTFCWWMRMHYLRFVLQFYIPLCEHPSPRHYSLHVANTPCTSKIVHSFMVTGVFVGIPHMHELNIKAFLAFPMGIAYPFLFWFYRPHIVFIWVSFCLSMSFPTYQ